MSPKFNEPSHVSFQEKHVYVQQPKPVEGERPDGMAYMPAQTSDCIRVAFEIASTQAMGKKLVPE